MSSAAPPLCLSSQPLLAASATIAQEATAKTMSTNRCIAARVIGRRIAENSLVQEPDNQTNPQHGSGYPYEYAFDRPHPAGTLSWRVVPPICQFYPESTSERQYRQRRDIG